MDCEACYSNDCVNYYLCASCTICASNKGCLCDNCHDFVSRAEAYKILEETKESKK